MSASQNVRIVRQATVGVSSRRWLLRRLVPEPPRRQAAGLI